MSILPWRRVRQLDDIKFSRDESHWSLFWRGEREIALTDAGWRSITYNAHGIPTFKWAAFETEYLQHVNELKYLVKLIGDDHRKVTVYYEHEATINPIDGNFVVTRSVKLRFICGENEKRVKRYLKVGANREARITWNLPADQLKLFQETEASPIELDTVALAVVNANRAIFIEHYLVRVEFTQGTFGTISRDFMAREHTRRVVNDLTREFISKRPTIGWMAHTKPLREARNQTPQPKPVTDVSAPAISANSRHDPI